MIYGLYGLTKEEIEKEEIEIVEGNRESSNL